MQAALDGHVRVIRDCLYVVPEIGSQKPVLPIFPAGRLRVADDGLYFNSTLLREGAVVSLGGGYLKSAVRFHIPAQCTNATRPFLVNNS